MTKSFSTLIIWIVSILALVFFVRYLAGVHAFPSFSEYIASTTSPYNDPDSSLLQIKTPKGVVRAYAARTADALSKGLSGQTSLNDDQGMLFIFPVAGRYDFWMKDMNFPLDIVWIDEDKAVIAVLKGVATSTYPRSFGPPGPISYVLELNADGAAKFGIATGTVLVF